MDSRLLAVNHYVIVYVKIENVKIKKKKRGQEVEFLEMYSWRIHYTILYSLLSRDHEDCWNSAMGGGGGNRNSNECYLYSTVWAYMWG